MGILKLTRKQNKKISIQEKGGGKKEKIFHLMITEDVIDGQTDKQNDKLTL